KVVLEYSLSTGYDNQQAINNCMSQPRKVVSCEIGEPLWVLLRFLPLQSVNNALGKVSAVSGAEEHHMPLIDLPVHRNVGNQNTNTQPDRFGYRSTPWPPLEEGRLD